MGCSPFPSAKRSTSLSVLFTKRGSRLLPNKRLKLAADDRFKGSGMLCPDEHELSFNDTARGARVARSLSAIR